MVLKCYYNGMNTHRNSGLQNELDAVGDQQNAFPSGPPTNDNFSNPNRIWTADDDWELRHEDRKTNRSMILRTTQDAW